jgi:hypothetical protein
MSELTHALATERPSRALCLEAAERIKHLEDALIEIQKMRHGIASDRYSDPLEAAESGLRQPPRRKGAP